MHISICYDRTRESGKECKAQLRLSETEFYEVVKELNESPQDSSTKSPLSSTVPYVYCTNGATLMIERVWPLVESITGALPDLVL